ncbi:MAG: ABC transporter permease subunit [Phycisphaerae bacterium]
MPDSDRQLVPGAPPLPRPPRPSRPSRRRSWLRYNWPKVFIHLLLIVLGVLNIYPFFWMLGTSVKAEAEASNNRLTPVPERKYKLSDDFELSEVLPTALQPGLAEAGADARGDLLNALKKKLEVLHHLQRAAWDFNVRRHVEQIKGGTAGLGALLQAGALVHDEANHSYWPGEELWTGRADYDDPAVARTAEELREYYSITADDYAQIAGLEPARAQAHLADLLHGAGAPLRPLPPTGEDHTAGAEQPPARYGLSPGARGRIYKDLYPRQILAMWSMHEENIRRHESRATFATDRWSPEDYRKNTSLHSIDRAADELHELVSAGVLSDGTFQWMNYWVVLKEENFILHFLTSLVITAAVVVLTVFVSSMLGYALARIRFPGKMVVLGVMISAAVLPGEARIIPIFKMLMAIRAMENLWGMVLWLSSFGVGNALLMAAFFLTLPRDVDEAAEVDGAGTWRKFFDVALPMARPIMVTVGLFAFLTAWNNFLVPLVCTISRPSMQPLAVAVYNFQQGRAGKWHQINAAAALMIVPVILMFLLVQKHVVRSIAVGAVKG